MQDQLLRFETEVKCLTDFELLNKLERIFVFEKKCADAILLGLKEIKARRLYITAGYSSLFDMLVKFYKLFSKEPKDNANIFIPTVSAAKVDTNWNSIM